MVRRTPLKKIGKIGKYNITANKILAQRWEDRGIDWCEIRLPGCLGQSFLQNVHRRKREYYRIAPELLYDDTQVVRGCNNCHQKIENDRELTEATFQILRGQEHKRIEPKKIENKNWIFNNRLDNNIKN